MINTRNFPQKFAQASRTALVLVALLVLAVAPALAWKATADAGSESTGQPVTIHVGSISVREVLTWLAAASELNFIIEPGTDLSLRVAVNVDDVPWDKVLADVLNDVDFSSSLEGNVLWVYGSDKGRDPAGPFEGQPIDLSLKDADLGETLGNFSEIAGLDVVLAPGIKGSVTLELKAVPWDQALDAVLRMNGLKSSVQDGVMQIQAAGADL